MQSAHKLALELVTVRMSQGKTLAEAKALAGADVAGIGGPETVTLKQDTSQPALTLSARTKEIMNEKHLPFAAAQRLASVEFRGMFIRGGR